MYKDLREKLKIDIIINVRHFVSTCGGCPTIYEFEDYGDTKYYFRLRHGIAIIVCEDTDETLLSDSMPGFDGVCSWDDVVTFALNNRIQINY